MGVVWYRFRAEARRGWRAWVALGILTGLGSGAVLALIAGARRTDSAVDRFVAYARPWDVLVTRGVPGLFDFAELDLDRVSALPEVVESVPILTTVTIGRTSGGRLLTPKEVNFTGDPTGRAGVEVDRLKVLRGRGADPSDVTEVTVSFRTAESTGLELGDTITAHFLSPEEIDVLAGSDQEIEQRLQADVVELRIVGIYATVRELLGGSATDIRLTPAALERYAYSVLLHQRDIFLEKTPDALPRFLAGVQALSGGQQIQTETLTDLKNRSRDAVRPVGRALQLAALLLGVVVLLLGDQALARQAGAEAGDDPTLVALGFTGGRLVAVRALKAAAIGLIAGVAAAVVAVAAAGQFPVGLAALVEPHPGIRVDLVVLGLGVPVVTVVFAGLGTAAGWWGTRRALSPARAPLRRPPARMATLLAGAGARPPVVAGVRAALGGASGRILSASVVTIALGLLATSAATAFSASLQHLTDTPVLYGWNWDARIGYPFAPAFGEDQVAELLKDSGLAALAVGNEVEAELGGKRRVLLGMENVVGDIQPSLISGRAATDLGDAVVSPGVARRGESLTARFAGADTELRVVGIAALPASGAMVTLDTLRLLTPETPTQLALVRAVDPTQARAFADRAAVTLGIGPELAFLPELGEEVANFGRVERLPVVLASLMALVALGTLLHTLLLSVGRRRRELAVLKALGFTRGQVMATVSAQASTLTALSLVVGVPLGVAAGRGLWLRFADGLGVVPVAVVPALAMLALATAAVALANLAATLPGWRAARTPAADTLRTE